MLSFLEILAGIGALAAHTLAQESNNSDTASFNSYISRPDLRRPTWDVIYSADSSVGTLAPGYFFVAPMLKGLMILDNEGEPVWLDDLNQSLPTKFNFQPQVYKDELYLTYWAGDVYANEGYGNGNGYMLDSSYREQCDMSATNGSDFHELFVTSDNTAITTIYNELSGIDLTGIEGGTENSWIVDSCFQDFGVESGQPAFTFCALENGLDIFDSYLVPSKPPVSQETAWDYAHLNSVEKDARDWRDIVAFGRNSTFQMNDDTAFSWQHHARFVGEENMSADEVASATSRQISLYDNAYNGETADAEESRGLLLDLNLDTMTATLVNSYHSPGGEKLLSESQGSMQVLQSVESSNVLIGYGSIPVFAEYTSEGQALLAVQYAADNNQIYVSWNGDTRTKSWRVVQSESMESLADSATEETVVEKTGFETEIELDFDGKVVRVDALNEDGDVLASSDVFNSDGDILDSGVPGTSSRGDTTLSCK